MSTQDTNVVSVMDLLDRWWGNNLTWEAVAQTIQAGRGKLLRIEILDLPPSIQGFCAGLRDCDVIGLRKTLDEQRLQFTKLHEASHLLLRHVPSFSFGDETPTYDKYRSGYEEWIEKSLHRNHHQDSAENAADILAYKLSERISAPKSKIPSIIRQFYIINTKEKT